MDDKEPFLSRWSRRKLETKEDAPAGAARAGPLSAAAAAPPVPATEPAAPQSPQAGSAEYRELFDPQVDEKLRQSALKKLFSEPQFNVMDGLDTYIDDYSIPDPMPEAMLRQLNQARELFLFDEEEKDRAGAGLAAGEGETAAAALDSEAGAPAELPAPATAATDADAADSAVPLRSGPGTVS